MKKVFTFLFFCFYCNQSYAWGWFDNEPAEQEVEVKKVDNTKSFIGFSVGAGVGIYLMFLHLNQDFLNQSMMNFWEILLNLL